MEGKTMAEIDWELCELSLDDMTFTFSGETYNVAEFEATRGNPWGDYDTVAELGAHGILPTSTGSAVVIQITDADDPDLDEYIYAAHYTP